MLKSARVAHGLGAEADRRDVLLLKRSGDARHFGEIAFEPGYVEDAALKLFVDSRCHEKQRSSCVCTD